MFTKKLSVVIVGLFITVFVLAGCNGVAKTNLSSTATPTTASNSSSTTVPVTQNGKTFTLEQLKTYNGQSGNLAYVSINGVVYDVTNAKGWKNGRHKGLSAGNDLSVEIQSAPHGTDVLKNLPVVGKLANN